MRLSTKSRYAVTAMLDLALNGSQGPVTLADISENQSISLSYLEQLFAALAPLADRIRVIDERSIHLLLSDPAAEGLALLDDLRNAFRAVQGTN